jgi:hypothetical protein
MTTEQKIIRAKVGLLELASRDRLPAGGRMHRAALARGAPRGIDLSIANYCSFW